MGDAITDANVAIPVVDGPVVVSGAVSVAGGSAVAQAALCRCGQSQNKPYCDGSHVAAGFTDSGAVVAGGEPGATDGPLHVTPMPDGPNLVAGAVTVRSADGSTEWHGVKAALCRCGASANKPFCDGTHKSIGFRAP